MTKVIHSILQSASLLIAASATPVNGQEYKNKYELFDAQGWMACQGESDEYIERCDKTYRMPAEWSRMGPDYMRELITSPYWSSYLQDKIRFQNKYDAETDITLFNAKEDYNRAIDGIQKDYRNRRAINK